MLTLAGSGPIAGPIAGPMEDFTAVYKVLSKTPQYLSAIAGIANQLPTYLPLVLNVLEDPALDDVITEVAKMRATSTNTPIEYDPSKWGVKKGVGIGLSSVVKPLKALNYVQANKWVIPTAIVGVIGIPLLLGFTIGRVSKRTP